MKPQQRIELELRHLPRFRIMDYLAQVGGKADGLCSVQGPGWSAYLEALEPDLIGTVTIERDLLVISGDQVAVDRVGTFMQRQIKRMRTGG